MSFFDLYLLLGSLEAENFFAPPPSGLEILIEEWKEVQPDDSFRSTDRL